MVLPLQGTFRVVADISTHYNFGTRPATINVEDMQAGAG